MALAFVILMIPNEPMSLETFGKPIAYNQKISFGIDALASIIAIIGLIYTIAATRQKERKISLIIAWALNVLGVLGGVIITFG